MRPFYFIQSLTMISIVKRYDYLLTIKVYYLTRHCKTLLILSTIELLFGQQKGNKSYKDKSKKVFLLFELYKVNKKR